MRKVFPMRALALLMCLVMALNLILVAAPSSLAADNVALAKFSFVQGGTATTATLPQTAVDGVFQASAFSHYLKTDVSYTASSKSIYTNGWENADQTEKYWQITTSSKGYSGLNVTFNAWGSGTAPKNFTLKYSADGAAFSEAKAYELADSSRTISVDLPAEAANADILILRFVATGTVSINGGTVASGGNSRMAEIAITGTGGGVEPLPKLDPPTATPAPGEYDALPDGITLSASAGASILYTLGSGEPDTLYAGPIAAALPVTVRAIARQDGHLDSDEAVFTYTKKYIPDPGEDSWVVEDDTGTALSVLYSNNNGLYADITGDFAAVSEAGFIRDGAPVTLTFGSGGANLSGLAGMSGKAYWLIKTSSRGMDRLVFSGTLRSSNTGPRDFKAQYSADGSTWHDVPDGDVTAGATVHSPFSVTLPRGASNRDTLYIRLLMSSEISANGGTVGSGGTHQINQIRLEGSYIILDNQVAPVAPSVSGGEVPLRTTVEFTSPTEGASVMLSTDGGSTYSQASSFAAETLPVTLHLKAVKAGMLDSRVKAVTYVQEKVKIVKPLSSSFDVAPGAKVTLTCETANASIFYKLGDSEYAVYEGPITLTELPATITAYATAPGCVPGDEVSYTYRKGMTVDEYNIYFGQLHSHTILSDGIGTPEQAYDYAKNQARQIDFLAITDHSNMFDSASASAYDINGPKGTAVSAAWNRGHEAADAATDGSFVGIYGYEMTWSGSTGGFGHINTYNTKGFESRNDSYFTANTADKATNGLYRYYERLTTAPGALSQLNHPGTTFGDFLDFNFYEERFDDFVNLIEVGNGEGDISSGGYFRSYDSYTRALDRGWHVAPSNNQDNHQGKWGDANTGRTVVLAQGLTRDDIYAAVAARRVYATEDDNLGIRFSLDGHPMGYRYPAGEAPDGSVNVYVKLVDPDNVIEGSDISIIVNYGQKAITRKVADGNGATLTRDENGTTFIWNVTLPASYAYYYVQLSEPSGLLAVTAPVWLGKVEDMGINRTTSSTVMPVKGEPMPVKTTLYNNEEKPLVIDRIEYSIGGAVIHENAAPAITLNKGDSAAYEFEYTPDSLGDKNIDVRVYATYGSEPRVYADVLKIKVYDPESLVTIAIDAAHYNAYVAGNYAGSYSAFLNVCAANNIRVKILSELTATSLEGCSALVMTPPATRAGTYTPRDGSPAISYTAQAYSEAELAVLADFAADGGSFLIGGVADYGDQKPDYPKTSPHHSSTQMNAVLEAIGATTRQEDDEVVDFDNKVNESYRLAFGHDLHNAASAYTEGVRDAQTYSFYSGCAVTIDPVRAEWLVKGFPTTFSIDADGDTNGTALSASTRPSDMNDPRIIKKPGEVIALAAEKLPGGGTAFVGGTVFFSDFEIPDFDAGNNVVNSNMMLVWNMLKTLQKDTGVTPIGEARKLELGKRVTIEGMAMTHSTGSNPELAFFDCLYVQDETGGINVFGITNDMVIKAGQTVRVTGVIHEYLGDLELMIESPADMVVVDEEQGNYRQKEKRMNPSDVTNPANNGWYAFIIGLVTKVEKDDAGKIKAFWLRDESSGNSAEARIFIDGYIGYSSNSSKIIENFVTVGNFISVAGFVSTDPDGQRLRVADKTRIFGVISARKTTVSPQYIVESLAANIIVNIDGYNLDGLSPFIVRLESEDGVAVSDDYFVPRGKNVIYIPKAPAAGTYQISVYWNPKDLAVGDSTTYALAYGTPLTVLPYNPDLLWTASKLDIDGKLAVKFNAPAAKSPGKFAITVDGKAASGEFIDDTTLLLNKNVADVDLETCVIVVKGVKFPLHFPSYSFTFTVR